MEQDAAARLTFAQLGAIAVPSRYRIIKVLGQRQANVTELSERTGLAKSTIHGHLQILVDVQLVRRQVRERKWVYHALTPLGRRLAEMDELHLFVLPPAALAIAMSGLAVLLWRSLRPPRQELPWGVPPIGAPTEPPPAEGDPLLVGALLLAAGLATLAIWWWHIHRGRRTL